MQFEDEDFRRSITRSRRLTTRSCETLLGICSGIMADAKLNDDEIMFLSTWIEDHSEMTTFWPGDVLAMQVRDILADGIITEDERNHMIATLTSITGGTIQQTGATSGMATDLPVNRDAVVTIPEKSFCFTGTFAHGNRKKCENAVRDRGGVISGNVTMKLDYLVLGPLVTPSWAHTSFGRKIEKAIDYQRRGCLIEIIDESGWFKQIGK